MDTSILEDLGLTNAEIKVYMALLELGSAKAGGVLHQTKLQNSVVHMTLGKLVEKGLASFVKQGRVKHYQATDPRNIVRWIDEKKHRFEQILPQLIERQNVQERQEAEVYENLRGLKAMLYNFIEDAEPGDEYLFFAFITAMTSTDREIFEFYRDFTDDRLRRGIVIKGVAHESLRPLFRETGFDLNYIVFVNFPAVQNMSVFRNKVIMTPWKYSTVSYLIHSKQVAENFSDYFHSIWDHYPKG